MKDNVTKILDRYIKNYQQVASDILHMPKKRPVMCNDKGVEIQKPRSVYMFRDEFEDKIERYGLYSKWNHDHRGLIASLYSICLWRRSKMIHRFDRDFYENLISNPIDVMDLPEETIFNMKEYYIAVELYDKPIVDGRRMVCMIYNTKMKSDGRAACEMVFFSNSKDLYTYTLHFRWAADGWESGEDIYKEYGRKCFPLIMYLCCDNSEIKEIRKLDRRRMNLPKRKNNRKVKRKNIPEIVHRVVGRTIGESIRKIKSERMETGNDRRTVRPHVRGGHIKRVRYGKGYEKVKIMWIQPTVVPQRKGWT